MIYKHLVAIAGLLAIFTFVSASPAQTRQIQGGNALDANPGVGTGGFNYAAPPPPINRANAIVTGNVGGGLGFRGYSPIRDTSQLFIDTPSSSLSGFRAAGVSVADVMQGLTNYQRRYYYDPSTTVTNVGAIQRGLNRPGSSTPASPFAVPRDDYLLRPQSFLSRDQVLESRAADRSLSVAPGAQRAASTFGASSANQAINERLLMSPLFARPALVPLPQLDRWEHGRPTQPRYRVYEDDVARGKPVDVEPGRTIGGRPSPLDRILNPDQPSPRDRVDFGVDRTYDASVDRSADVRSTERITAPRRSLLGPTEPEEPQGPEPLAEATDARPAWLGQDRFSDMAAAARTLNAPGTVSFTAPETDSDADALAQDRYRAWAREYLATPVTSLVGQEQTVVNNDLARAEAAMHAGEYYRASTWYDIAGNLAPTNPLPLVGRAHALLAAGEYRTAARLLSRAIDRFPAIAFFRFDLTAFVRDPLVLERRRADLERLLERNDDYQFRFLLGWLEYYSGYDLEGLENLAKAAAAAPADSAIARLPELLKQRTAISPFEPVEPGTLPGAEPSQMPTANEESPRAPSDK
jgi:hypothetical protein